MSTKKFLRLQLICVFGILMSLLFIGYLLRIELLKDKEYILQYKEDNKIDYKVYLKNNDFFESKYLESGRTYITSLIDHINVDFKYRVVFDQEVSGSYKYHIAVKVESNKSNTGANYWSKDYVILDEKVVDINNQKKYNIHENVDIDYNKYNEILMSFKKSLGLNSSEGVLKVYLVVDGNVNGEEVGTPISSQLLLSMPLSEMTIEAKVNLKADSNIKTVKKKMAVNKSPVHIVLIVVYSIFAIVCGCFFIYFTKLKKEAYKYELTLKKILNTYDSIIVNVNTLPEIYNYHVIEVSSFEELLDAHSEVRMPINYYNEKNRCCFMLLNDKTCWVYRMKKTR